MENEPFRTKSILVQEMEAQALRSGCWNLLKLILGLIAAVALLKYIFD
jgi:hypothetical protein